MESSHTPYSQQWYDKLEQLLGPTVCRQLGLYVIPDTTRLSVVIPVYNEAATLEEIIERVSAVPISKEIILVDDCSTDGSRDLLKSIAERRGEDLSNTVKVAFHPRNRGKGAAVRTGFGLAEGDVVLIQDADLEYDPAEYPRLIKPIVDGQADVVYGSRFLGDQPHRVLYFFHYLANRFLTTLSNLFTNLNLTDMETCYKVFRGEVIKKILPRLQQNRFGIEPEITARVARSRYRIYEVAISYSGRTYGEGKKIGLKDGFSALWCIVRYGMFR
ncbi:MAG: glycosyltransferase family 2 protein [Planctomycetota bacterium]|nr:glycosyltransferase family 2 protein [Planctomycetota bacterium]